jgi:hypothetical protein
MVLVGILAVRIPFQRLIIMRFLVVIFSPSGQILAYLKIYNYLLSYAVQLISC